MTRDTHDMHERAAVDVGMNAPQGDAFDESLHALPGWFAWFQKTFGLSFLVLASAYLLGKLATLGWVPDINTPANWGVFDGAGVVIFFLAGVAVAGIGLTCSVVFVAAIKRRSWFIAVVTGLGMLLFFGVEVWASLSERSGNLHATPADLAVLSALGFRGLPPIGPTVIVVSALFPLGSLYFGFVQQRRAAVTQIDLAEDAMEMRRRIQQAEYEGQLAEAQATKRAAQARGAVNIVRAGVEAARQPRSGLALEDRESARVLDADRFADRSRPDSRSLATLAHVNGYARSSGEDDFIPEDDEPPF